MAYKISLFGYSGSGKTRLFETLTGRESAGKQYFQPVEAAGLYADSRLHEISAISQAEKIVRSSCFIFRDAPGFPREAGFPKQYFSGFMDADIICCVVNNFEDSANPLADARSLLMEMQFHDTEVMEKLRDTGKLSHFERERLDKAVESLAGEAQLRDLPPEEMDLLRGKGLLTLKEIIYFFNGMPGAGKGGPERAVKQQASDPSQEELYRLVKDSLGLISFFTVKGDISQEWVIPGCWTAREAAAKIHRDIGRCFIRAVAVPAAEFIKAGSWEKAKKSGLVRILGPCDIISEGDIVEFLCSK